MSENLGIKIDLELSDEKAKSDLNSVIESLQKLTKSKAVNLKVDIDGDAVKGLEKIEKAVKEINKLSKKTQDALFNNSFGKIDKDDKSTKEYWDKQKEEQRKAQLEQEQMYKKHFDSIIKEEEKALKARQQAEQRKIQQDNQILLAGKREEERIRAQQEKNEQKRIAEQGKRMAEQRKQQIAMREQEKKDSEKALKDMATYYNNLEKEQAKIEKKNAKEYDNLIKSNDKDTLSGYISQLNEKNKALKASMDKESSMLKAQEREYKSYSDSLANSMSKAQKEITNMSKSGFADSASLSKLQGELDRLITSVNWDKVDKLTFDKSIAEVRKLESEIKQALDIQSKNKRQSEINLFSDKMFTQLDKMKSEFRKIGDYGSEFDRIKASIRGLDDVAPDRLPQSMKQIRQEVGKLNTDLKELNTKTSGNGGFFGDLYDSMRTFTLGNMIGNALEDGVRAIKTVIMDLDSALTDMMKVAPEGFEGTGKQLKQVARDANEVAKSVGQSTEDVIQGTAKALQTGAKTMEDAMEIARSSSMLANVGDLQQDQADTYIASIMSAYGGMSNALKPVRENIVGMSKDYNTLTKFMDIANYAGNNFAISTGDVGEALQRSGAVLSEYGVSMQDAVAMIVGANESVQDSAKVGTGMKSMAINLAGVKANAQDGTLELNKTAKALKEIGGVDVYANKKTGEIKDMMTILSDLRKNWEGLRQDEQLAIGEAVAGKHHANTFQAMMGNWETVLEMQKAYNTGMTLGSAEKENARYLDSVAGKVNAIKENLKQLLNNVISSDFAKGMLDIGVGITDGLVGVSNFIDKLGLSVPTAVAMMTSLVQVFKKFGTSGSPDIINWWSKLGKVMKGIGKDSAVTVSRVTSTGKSFKIAGYSADTLNNKIGKLRDGNLKLVNTTGKTVKVVNDSTKAVGQSTRIISQSTKAVNSTTKATGGLGKAFLSSSVGQTALSVGTSLLNGALVGLAGAGISLAIQGVVNLATATKRAREESAKNIDSIQTEMSINRDKISTLDNVGRKYEELAKKTNKNAKETEEMNKYANELADILPELKIGEDSNGNAIISMAGDVDYLIKKLEQANETQARLLKGEQSEKAESSMKMLSEQGLFNQSALFDRDVVQRQYNSKMEALELERVGILNKIRTAEGEDLKDYNRKLEKLEAEKEKITLQYGKRYIEENQKVQELANDIRQNSLNTLMDSFEFTFLDDKSKQNVQDFVSMLDFSESNADNIYKYDDALKKISKSVLDGKLDMEKYKEKVMNINEEFSQSQNVEAYDKQMRDLANSISKVSGADYETVLNMLKSMDTYSLQAEGGLSKFLGAYNKTMSDVSKGDKVAEAVKAQFDGIQMALSNISSAFDSEDIKIHRKVVLDLLGDENIPEQLQTMIRTLLDKGHSETDILKVSQRILLDLQQDGEVNIEEAQKWINEAFGEGAFEIDAGINVTAKVNEARTDEVLNALKEQFKEIPTEVETIIKTNTVTSQREAETILNMYKDFPTEINTWIETLGYEGAYEKVSSLENKYKEIPSELMTYLKANGVDSIEKATHISSIYSELPENVQTYLLANNSEALLNAKNVDDVYSNLPTVVNTTVEFDITKAESGKTIFQRGLEALAGKTVTTSAEMDIGGWNKDKGVLESSINTLSKKKASVKVDGDTAPLDSKVKGATNKVNNIKQSKKVKIDGDSTLATKTAKKVQKDINDIKQDKPAKILADSSNAMTKISNVKEGFRTLPSSKTTTINVVTKYKTEGTPTAHSKGSTFNFGRHISPEPVASEMVRNIPVPMAEPAEAPIAEAPSVFATARKTASTPIDTSKSGVLDSVKFTIELLKELANRITIVSNQASLLDEKMKHAVGKDKIKYLQEQNKLFKEQMELQKELESKLKAQQTHIKSALSGKGFKFNADGNLTNYEEKLLAMEREAERLQKIADSSSKKASDYTGKNETTKKNLDKQAQADKDKVDKYKESLSETKKLLSEYISITMNELPNTQKEWQSLNNQIKDNEEAIKKENQAIKEQNDLLEKNNRRKRTYKFDNKLKELEHQYEAIALQLDIIDSKMGDVYGEDKIKLIQSQIKLLEEQQKKQKEIFNQYNSMIKEYQKDLGKFGFKFDNKQNVTNLDEVLNNYEGKEDLEKINKLLEEYLDLHGDMDNATKEWEKLESEIKSLYKEQLKITKEVEDKITEVYKKQVEERKKLIDEELDARLKAIDKEKQAYNDARKEADYNKDKSKQEETIADLEKQLAIAMRDTSQKGQKKVQELMKQLAEEQEKLSEMVQSKLDEQINNMFDKESDRLEEEANKKKEELDDKYSDENLKEIVKDAISTGVFVGVDGEIKDLQQTLIDFENKFGDGMSAMGDIIKNELVANLNIAKTAMADLSNIMNELDLKKYSSDLNVTTSKSRSVEPVTQPSSPIINFNSELIKIEGNVDSNTIPKIREIVDEVKEEIVDEIIKNIR